MLEGERLITGVIGGMLGITESFLQRSICTLRSMESNKREDLKLIPCSILPALAFSLDM